MFSPVQIIQRTSKILSLIKEKNLIDMQLQKKKMSEKINFDLTMVF